MKYVYTMPMCGACEDLKKDYKKRKVDYIERDGGRLRKVPVDVDDIDRSAMVVLSMQNMTFPVVVEE